MIVVKIELWPFGSEAAAREIGRAHIWNDATGDAAVGNYGYKLMSEGCCILRTGTVRRHFRARGVWELLRRCLRGLH